MLKYTENGKVIVWMNLLGFEKNDPDKGVKRFLDTAGFKPDGICGLLCHPDFYLQHKGMDEEYVLPPDICAYWGVPRNLERERQEWTNYDVRELVFNLKAEGIEFYGGVFGSYINSSFHREWVEDHPELLKRAKGGVEKSIFVLKRFKDGSYFEDYFAEKMCKTLADYGMAGAHFADRFCPPAGGMLHSMEFSTDYTEQFLAHAGLRLPEELMVRLGDDGDAAVAERADYIYENLRVEWIEFNAWRWESFFKKICEKAHRIGKKILALAMYCTDPFETLYCIGISLKRLVGAGVDYITANILPTGTYLCGRDDRPYFFHKYMAIAPTTAAHLPKGHLISMLGVQDATEEWNAIYDRPVMHQKDMYTMMSYQLMDKDGLSRCLEGFFLCLGDGLTKNDWEWEHQRLEAALSATPVKMYSPMMLWSERANEALLPEYITTRRWSAHKFLYELQKCGTFLGGTVLPEAIDSFEGAIFAPNFDLLSHEEKQLLIHRKGAVLATARPDFSPSSVGASATLEFSDKSSGYPMKAFLLNKTPDGELVREIESLLSEEDGAPSLTGDLKNLPEPIYTLTETLVFQKVSRGFVKALGKILAILDTSPFEIDKPSTVMGMADGAYRLYLFNDSEEKYHRAFVKCKREVASTRFISKYPILPPKFMDAPSSDLHHIYKDDAPRSSFQVKIQPGGVTIMDIYLKD